MSKLSYDSMQLKRDQVHIFRYQFFKMKKNVSEDLIAVPCKIDYRKECIFPIKK